MKTYLSQHFPGLSLEKPFLHSWPIALRFEIGPDEIPLWLSKDKEMTNPEYFKEALNRATTIFELLFDKDDDLILVFQEYSKGIEVTKENGFLSKYIKQLDQKEVIYSDEEKLYYDEDPDLDDKSWKRVVIKLKTNDIDYIRVLEGSIYNDFSLEGPSLGGECFFINATKNIILHLYDDRGMDVISSKKTGLGVLYRNVSDWILY